MRARLRRFKGGQRFRDPRSLFMGNAQGFWLDFTDMSTMFQDSAGTIPVTALGDPVGLVRDKSGNGYDASITTASARPTFGRMPYGGVRNRLQYSEELGQWSKVSCTVSDNAALDARGNMLADKIVEAAAVSSHVVYRTFSVASGEVISGFAEVKAAERAFALIAMAVGFSTSAIQVNLTTGAVSVGLGAFTSLTSTDLGTGWWRVDFTLTATATTSSAEINIYTSTDGVWANRSYLGDITKGILVGRTYAQGGSASGDYQKVRQAYDVTEAGVESVPCLWFDGVDDHLSLAATGILRNCGRFTAVAGATFTAAITTSRALFLASTASDAGSARFVLQGQATGNLAVRGRRLDSDSIATANSPQSLFDAGVFSAVVSYQAAFAHLRRDSVEVAANNSFQTPGNTSDSNSAAVQIGRLSTAYFGGFMSSALGIRDVTLTASQLASLENYFMNQMGIAA